MYGRQLTHVLPDLHSQVGGALLGAIKAIRWRGCWDKKKLKLYWKEQPSVANNMNCCKDERSSSLDTFDWLWTVCGNKDDGLLMLPLFWGGPAHMDWTFFRMANLRTNPHLKDGTHLLLNKIEVKHDKRSKDTLTTDSKRSAKAS